MKRKLLWFLVGSMLLGIAAAVPAWLLAEEVGLLFVGTALVLCLFPMTATLVWTSWSFHDSPENQLLAVMGGTALRMFFVVVSGLVLYLNFAVYNQQGFMFWVVFFYLATLAMEVALLVGKPSKSA